MTLDLDELEWLAKDALAHKDDPYHAIYYRCMQDSVKPETILALIAAARASWRLREVLRHTFPFLGGSLEGNEVLREARALLGES